MPKSTTWRLEPHTAAKHAILKGYLDAWFPILASNRGRVVFLDGFAGPGEYEGGEMGSPMIALNSLMDHAYFPKLHSCEFVFLFNEMDSARFAALEGNLASLRASREGWPTNIRVHAVNQGFQSLANELIAANGDRLAPTFAFLDPFGYKGLEMATLAQLLAAERCEILCYFDYNSANRFATAGNVDQHFESLFGCDEFRQAPPAGDPTRGIFLIKLFEKQLRDVANFTHVQSFAMRNSRGITSHYLVFGTRSLKGLDKMKQVMWKLAPTGDYSFSDRFAEQDVLFGAKPDTKPLQQALLTKFGTKTATIEEITTWIVANTPYHSSHVKRATLKVMQEEGLLTANPQRRRGEFVDGCKVTFNGDS